MQPPRPQPACKPIGHTHLSDLRKGSWAVITKRSQTLQETSQLCLNIVHFPAAALSLKKKIQPVRDVPGSLGVKSVESVESVVVGVGWALTGSP